MGIVNIFKCEFDLSEIVGSKLKLWIQRIFIYKDIFLKIDRFLKKILFLTSRAKFLSCIHENYEHSERVILKSLVKNSRFSCSQYNYVGSFHYFKINLWVNFLCVKNIHQFKCACIQDKSTLRFLEGVWVIVCYIRTRNVQLGIFFITTIHWDKTEDKGHMLMFLRLPLNGYY